MSCDTCKDRQTQGSIPGNVYYEMEAFKGLSFMALAEKYDLSLNGVKKIVYGQGDKVLLRAAKRI